MRLPPALSVLLAAATLILWLPLAVAGFTLRASDPAGNGLTAVYGVVLTLAVWALLAVQFVAVAIQTPLSPSRITLAFLLLLGSGVATLAAIFLGSQSPTAAGRWIGLIPALAPALLLLDLGANSSARLRGWIGYGQVAPYLWGTLIILSLLPWPLVIAHQRMRATRRRASVPVVEPASHQRR